jgi:hypothetical protein
MTRSRHRGGRERVAAAAPLPWAVMTFGMG